MPQCVGRLNLCYALYFSMARSRISDAKKNEPQMTSTSSPETVAFSIASFMLCAGCTSLQKCFASSARASADKERGFCGCTVIILSKCGAVSAFVLCLDPLVTDLNDLKTAVSEAVTNAIVHGYRDTIGTVYITAVIYADGTVQVKVRDRGCGIPDIEKAMEPLFTTGGEERAGLGFAVMQSFCDSVRVISKPQKGTTVTLTKRFERKPNGE